MKNILLVSGSPRKGNTEFILDTISKEIQNDYSTHLLFLRNKKIKHCMGCLKCDKTNTCTIKDDMTSARNLFKKANLIIIGSPNYYDNISGLLKNFIDRTNPFYNTNMLKNKKIIFIVVGGGSIKHSQRVIDHVLKYFADAHGLKIAGSYVFKALKPNEIKNSIAQHSQISKIISQIKKIK